MNAKRFWLAAIVVFIFIFFFEWLVNGVLLGPTYVATASVWRTPEQMHQLYYWVIIGQVLFALIFCFIFTRGHSDRGARGGFIYGFWLSLLFGTSSFMWYVVLPVPALLCVWWFISGVVQLSVSGLLLGAIYKR